MKAWLLYALTLAIPAALSTGALCAVDNPRQWHGNSVVQVRETTPAKPAAKKITSKQPSQSGSHRHYNYYRSSTGRTYSGSRRSYNYRTFTGDVLSIGKDSIRIRTGDNIYTVKDVPKARITVPGISHPEIYDINIGDRVNVTAYRAGTDVYGARTIQVVEPVTEARAGRGSAEEQFPERFSLVGVISSIDANSKTFHVRTIGGRDYVVNASNSSVLMEGRDSSFSNLQEGDSVRIRGSLSENRITAYVVNEVSVGYVGQQTALIGTLDTIDVNARTLLMTRGNRKINVKVQPSARIVMYGRDVNLGNISQGSNVKVKGRWTSSSDVDADYVEVYPPKD